LPHDQIADDEEAEYNFRGSDDEDEFTEDREL
jgi:hypothetical protein